MTLKKLKSYEDLALEALSKGVYFRDYMKIKDKVHYSHKIFICLATKIIRIKKGLKTYFYKFDDYGRLWGITKEELRN